MTEFYSNGKLLLSGEYAILDGALGLALPTKFGQYLSVKASHTGQINWQSLTEKNTPWFTADINLSGLKVLNTSDVASAKILVDILKKSKNLNPSFLDGLQGVYVDTKLTFRKDWGLGSSSTLINNLAQWAELDAYALLEATFGGSGYDIACAQNDTAIVYQKKGSERKIQKVDFEPKFKDHLFFVYLNKKRNSREAIKTYRQLSINKKELIVTINQLTRQMVACTELEAFQRIMDTHENVMSRTLGIPTVKEQYFIDYQGSIKSLGAWGGDFIMVTGTLNDMIYFSNKGFTTILPYSKMILQKKPS